MIRLEQNYRSTPHILAAASGVIAANKGRLGKTLWTDAPQGEKVRLIGLWDGEEEARWIAEEIEALGRGTRGLDPVPPDASPSWSAPRFQMRAFEDRFLTIGLPYRVIGGPRFYERQEIRDAMAYFRVAVSPDDDLAFERIVNMPKRGIGDKALQEINGTARANGVSLLDGAGLLVADGGLPGPRPRRARPLVDDFDRWHALIREGTHRPRRDRRADPGGERLHRHVARPRSRPTPPAGSRTSRSWSRRWTSSRTCRASSSTSRWSWTTSRRKARPRSRS